MKTLKVVLLGNSGVGKTCLRSQFVHHIFTNAYKATIGGDYLTSTIQFRDQEIEDVCLQIWDTAGQERFNSISQAFYRGTDVCVLVYDVTNYESLLALNHWFARFMKYCHVDNPAVVLVGNKTDKQKVVSSSEVISLLDRERVENSGPRIANYLVDEELDIIEASSKKLDEVSKVFTRVAEVGVKCEVQNQTSKLVSLDLDIEHKKQSGGCCF